MNWKIYEWIGVQIFFWKIYEWIGRYTNELGFRFFFGIVNIYFILSIGGLGFWNLKIYEWIGRYTNELGFRFFWKIYEWIGRYTNELGFRFFLENIRMNWKIYAWIGVQIFFWNNKYLFYILYWRIRMLKSEDIRMNWKIYEWIGVQIFFCISPNSFVCLRISKP